MAKNSPNLPLFITGHPRSGTTLLRLIFNKHSQLAIPDETGMFHWFYKRPWYKQHTRSRIRIPSPKSLAFGEPIIEAFNKKPKAFRNNAKESMGFLYKEYAKSVGKQFWGDKTPLHTQFTDQILKLFPNAFIINLVRDPRAVISSAKRNMKNKREGTDFWITDDLDKTIERWKWEYGLIQRFTSKYSEQSVLLIYEDFVANPEMHLRSLCEQIGLPFEPEMLNYHKDSNKEVKDMNAWHKETTKPINIKNIDKWKEELDANEIEQIESSLKSEMTELGYLK
ncbi:MAG: sulfotransferase [Bacteroidia bacterium]